MSNLKRGQISTEYLLVISFVIFVILTILGIALIYSSQMKDSLKFNQVESFAQNVISEAEKIYYAGHPSKTVVRAYLPEGIKEVRVFGNFLIFNISTSSGESVIAFRSNVNLTGNMAPNSGLRVIYLNATPNAVIVSG